MPESTKTFRNLLTDKDRVIVRLVRDGRRVLRFSVQYEALIDSRWRKITRFDNAHGYPHRHVYNPDGIEYRYSMSAIGNNQAFTEAQTVIKKDFIGMRERYIINLDRSRRGGGRK